MILNSDTRAILDLTAAKSNTTYRLAFRAEPLRNTQARFQGRYTLVPEVDLKAYTYRAVIDWLEVRVGLGLQTQARWLHKQIERAGGVSVFVLETTGRHTGSEFTLRFQEPQIGSVKAALSAISTRWGGFARDPELTGLEISLDVRPRIYSEQALARLFGVLVRTHLPSRDVITNANDRPRFSWGKERKETRHVLPYSSRRTGPVEENLRRVDLDEIPVYDATYYAGAKGSPCAWRTMIKTVDEQHKSKGTKRELSKAEHRVRLEVTLLEPELRKIGLATLDDLAKFSFQKFQGGYFSFFLPTFEQPGRRRTPALQAITTTIERQRRLKFLKAGVVGLKAMDETKVSAWKNSSRMSRPWKGPPRATVRRGRGQSLTLVSYEQLTKQMIHSLHHLGERQRASLR